MGLRSIIYGGFFVRKGNFIFVEILVSCLVVELSLVRKILVKGIMGKGACILGCWGLSVVDFYGRDFVVIY